MNVRFDLGVSFAQLLTKAKPELDAYLEPDRSVSLALGPLLWYDPSLSESSRTEDLEKHGERVNKTLFYHLMVRCI